MRIKGQGELHHHHHHHHGEAEGVERPSHLARALKRDGFEGLRNTHKTTTTTKVSTTEPALAKLDDGTTPTYKKVTGSLFADGASAEDVVQGQLGDCYFLSSLASLAQRRPQDIEKLIRSNGDGTYAVTLYTAQKNGTMKPTTVTVDNLIPEDKQGNAVYASSPNSKELWVELVEKAYAKLEKGYKVINNGGIEADAMATLTGKPSNQIDLNPKNADALYSKLETAISQGKLTTAGTFSEDDLATALDQYNAQGLTDLNSSNFNYQDANLVDGHAYSVLGVYEDGGEKYVTLRNPWGETEPSGDGKDDGEFTLKLSDFALVFEEVTIGG